MKAVLETPAGLSVSDVPDPVPGAHDHVIDVDGCGICGSDLSRWALARRSAPGAGGHEIVGRVRSLGPSFFSPGDRVLVDPTAIGSCGSCLSCRAGAFWFCSARVAVGPGGFAERLLAPARALHPVPRALPSASAVLAEPVACGLHALRSSWTVSVAADRDGLPAGTVVGVVGAGMLGLGAVLAARALGAARVVCLARHPHQAAAAASLGADVLDARDPGAVDVLRRARPPVVVDAVGGPGLEQAVRAVAWRGEVVGLGGGPSVTLTGGALSAHETRLFFPVSTSARDLDAALKLLAQHAAEVATWSTVVDLTDIEEARRLAGDKSAGVVRVVVRPPRGRL